MSGISDKALKTQYPENKYRFNKGSELQNKEFTDGSGLEWYDAQARGYDPQLGRFMQIDPLPDKDGQESLTPYQFGSDDPVRYNDPSGKCPTCILGAFIGAAVDIGAQMIKNKLEGKPLSDINYKEVAVAAVAGFATSGVSAIYGDAAVAGTELVLSKTASTAVVAGVTSVLNQANDASDKGKPLNISPVKIVTDIATDKLSDHLSEKIPEIKVNGSAAPKLTEATKTAAGDATSKAVDLITDLAKPSAPTKLAPIQLGVPAVVNQADATAHKIYVPKLRDQ